MRAGHCLTQNPKNKRECAEKNFMKQENPSWLSSLERDGFVLIPNVLNDDVVDRLIISLEAEHKNNHAIRNLLQVVPEVRQLVESATVRALVEPVLCPAAFAARGLFFDKTPEANWKVPWHQDLTIAVRSRIEAPGFGPWSVKSGVHHVQPPTEILEPMVTVRLNLDDCTEQNGPLRVLPESHRFGKLTPGAIRELRDRTSAVSCVAKRGGALLMRPLLLHASSRALSPYHRRIIHLEFAAELLPEGLEWLKAVEEAVAEAE